MLMLGTLHCCTSVDGVLGWELRGKESRTHCKQQVCVQTLRDWRPAATCIFSTMALRSQVLCFLLLAGPQAGLQLSA